MGGIHGEKGDVFNPFNFAHSRITFYFSNNPKEGGISARGYNVTCLGASDHSGLTKWRGYIFISDPVLPAYPD